MNWITEEQVIYALRSIKWTKSKNRKNVMTQRDNTSGGVYSMVFGKCFIKYKHYGELVANQKYPEVFNLLKQLIYQINPTFSYTTITVNKNLECAPHKDTHNSGPSIIIGFGMYQGGDLFIQVENKIYRYNVHCNPVLFNGNNLHWTEPFIGERYTIVYYTYKH